MPRPSRKPRLADVFRIKRFGKRNRNKASSGQLEMILTYVFIALVGLYTAAAAVVDLRTRRIPNYLTVTAAALGLAYHTLVPGGWGALTSLGGFAVGFALLLLPWLLGGGGAGDVKLLGALGAWLGPKYMLVAFALSIFFAAVGAVVVLAVLAMTKGAAHVRETKLAADDAPATRKNQSASRRRMLPFAVPVAVSTWLLLAWIATRGAL
ncbi:MAG: prepilin peptidase [Planctomycetota bacterium]|nr:MAG: prepilin peptidase [Planctomycetota bacterium]